jgi:hypothetical protein
VKLQNILRMQAMVIGLGAALFMASSAPAQEIDNTVWPGDSGKISAAPSDTAIKADNLAFTAANAEPAQTPPERSSAVATQASLSETTPVNRWDIVLLLICLVVGIVYVRETSKRMRQSQQAEAERM